MFSSFTMETILATAFGRHVNLQRGESDELSKSVGVLIGGFTEGQAEKFILLDSKLLYRQVAAVLEWGLYYHLAS